ncbi:putative LysR family transcriptional regulator [Gordonia effusa NBRC 100432]|uniref:Putative LysR family transcriptional regulator n=1 Tax=Gordonia effusa NBRC 100432 TaxID=1077974 RepID=H0QX42_9ACTN|nr:LysR family transcriptional regulator [Gordonia effusa]GAB17393.1 putative LysR family transcriptional regulator [Gordonia effusa NBRC 100432]
MIDTHRLMIFRSVVATGSVGGAAATLGYTSSAISQHVTALQRETGLTLVERSGRGIEPTPAGRVLADAATKLMQQVDELAATVEDLRAGTTGRIVVSGFSSAVTGWMPDVVAALTADFPDTRVLVRIEEDREAVREVRPDIAILVGLGRTPPIPGYASHELLVEPYVAVLNENHELAGRSAIDMAELAAYRWIDSDTSDGPCRQNMLTACAAAGFTPSFAVETSDYPAALRFVARDVGLTVVPQLGAAELPVGTVSVPLTNPTPERTICVYVKDSRSYDPAVVRTVELLHRSASSGKSSE